VYALLGATLLLLGFFVFHARFLKKEINKKEANMKHLEELANIDSLTLIYNRHMLDTVLVQQLAMVERYNQMLSIVFFDIDSFKKINDRYGHAVGDEVLVDLSRLVSRSIRSTDFFGRWGGDEFLIILPEDSQKQARRFVDLLEKKIANHRFASVKKLSCSFGVVSYRMDDTLKDIMDRADAELYEAKKQRKMEMES
jgi:polar amino acid transport system substrate-binding protein